MENLSISSQLPVGKLFFDLALQKRPLTLEQLPHEAYGMHSFAVMNIAMVPLGNVHLICNLDATQFAVGDSKGGRRQTAELEDCDQGGEYFSYFIKYFLYFFADGSTGPPVYVVADGSIDGNDIDVYRVPALGISTELYSVSYVVFCKSRCCNINFFLWIINETILFEAIRSRKEVFRLLPKSMTWFQLDGEPVQIEVYEDPAMLENFLTRTL